MLATTHLIHQPLVQPRGFPRERGGTIQNPGQGKDASRNANNPATSTSEGAALRRAKGLPRKLWHFQCAVSLVQSITYTYIHTHAYRYIHDTSVGCCLTQLSHFHEFVRKLFADLSTFRQIGQTFDKLNEIGQICKSFASLSKLDTLVRFCPISRNLANLSRKKELYNFCRTMTSSSTFDKFDKI